MCSIWALVFEIVDEVTDKEVAYFFLTPISEMFQDVSLVYVFFRTITLSAQYLESSEPLLIRPATVLAARSTGVGHHKQD